MTCDWIINLTQFPTSSEIWPPKVTHVPVEGNAGVKVLVQTKKKYRTFCLFSNALINSLTFWHGHMTNVPVLKPSQPNVRVEAHCRDFLVFKPVCRIVMWCLHDFWMHQSSPIQVTVGFSIDKNCCLPQCLLDTNVGNTFSQCWFTDLGVFCLFMWMNSVTLCEFIMLCLCYWISFSRQPWSLLQPNVMNSNLSTKLSINIHVSRVEIFLRSC